MNYYYKCVKYRTKYRALKEFMEGYRKDIMDGVVKEVPYMFPKKRTFGQADLDKIKISNVSVYSMSSYRESTQIAEHISKILGTNDLIITDATANVGGNTYGFAKYFKFVNAVELEPLHYEMLSNNMKVLDVGNRVKCILGDYTTLYGEIKQDVIFIDPPWGGPDYKKKTINDLNLSGIDLVDFVRKLLANAKLIVLRLPNNFNFNNLFNQLGKNGTTFIVDKIQEHTTPHYVVYIHGTKGR